MLQKTDTPPGVTRRAWVIAAVMAAMFMIAIEATIVSTAMPQIAGRLGDLHLYAWVFAAFLLTQTATTVVFGKLSDQFGRRPILLVGIAVFLVGSLLCGFAWSMGSMILFRLLQGVGAGAIQPVGLTVVGDLFPARERGKVQGYIASVWGISSILGPLAGGIIVERLSWPWIFWINIPIGLVAALGFILFLHERVGHETRQVDGLGAGLFTLAVAALMVALTQSGLGDWTTVTEAGAVTVVAVILFVLQERRAKDPMIHFGLWSRKLVAAINGATLLAGVAMIGATTFLPMHVQGVMGQSPLVAGFALTMMVLGWPVASTLAARNFHRFGLRPIFLAGAALLPIASLCFVLLGPGSSPILAGFGSLILGCGLGMISTAGIILIQDSVGWSERGSATASNVFSRNLGNTLGAAALGAVLNHGLAHGSAAGEVTSDQLRALLDRPGSVAVADPAVRAVLDHSLNLTFWAVVAASVVTVALALLIPRAASVRPRPAGE